MIHDHKEQLPMLLTKMEYSLIVHGIPWLPLHDVTVRFASNMVTFGSQYCMTHCHHPPVTVESVTEEPSELVYATSRIFEPQIRPQ